MSYLATFSDYEIDSEAIVDRPSIDRPDPMTPKQIKAQYWMELQDRGISSRQLAAMDGVSHMTVQRAIREARALIHERDNRDPHAVPLLGGTQYAPEEPGANRAPCRHEGAIPKGSQWYCPECQQYGREYHPALKLDPNDPLLKTGRKKYQKAAKKACRKQRRSVA